MMLFTEAAPGVSVAVWSSSQAPRRGLLSRGGARTSHCAGSSCWGLGLSGVTAPGAAARGLGSCCSPTLKPRLQQLWCMGWAAPWHVGPSWPREQVRASCAGRRVLYHWATGEALSHRFTKLCSYFQFYLYNIVVGKDDSYFSLPKFFETCLWPRMWSILEEVPHSLKKVYSTVFRWNVL